MVRLSTARGCRRRAMAAASPPPAAVARAARVGLLYDKRMCAHATPDRKDHPENPERLRAIWRKLNAEGFASRFDYGSFYPYEEDGSYCFTGEEAGKGYSINVPWEHGKCGDADYIAAWDHVLLPVTEAFDPDIILVSAGFDAALGDPLGGCCITPNGYSLLLTKLLGFSQGWILMALEGGYNLRSTANSVFACAKVLLGDKFTFNSSGKQPFESTWRIIQAVHNELKTCWVVLSNKLQETVSWIAPSPSDVHFPTSVCTGLSFLSLAWPVPEETQAGRNRGFQASVPGTLERSPTCFNQCNHTVPTDRQRGKRAMKAIDRQMTPEAHAEVEDEELAAAEATAAQGFFDVEFGSDSSDSDYTPPTPPARVSDDAKARGSGAVQSEPTTATSLATTTAAAGPSDI